MAPNGPMVPLFLHLTSLQFMTNSRSQTSSTPSSPSSSSSLSSLSMSSLSRPRHVSRRRLGHLFSTFSTLFVFLASLHSPYLSNHYLVEAVSCTNPTYNTKVQPGQVSVLAWQASNSDLDNYDTLSATLYCMDNQGSQGGMWRTAATLFQNRGLVAANGEYQFSVPDCGPYARDVAIRLVAVNKGSTSRDDTACYFTMNPVAVEPPPQPQPTTTKPNVVTSNPPTQPPPATKPPVATPPSISNHPSPTSTIHLTSTSGASSTPTTTSSPFPFTPLPPLPPLPSGAGKDDDVTGTGSGGGHGGNVNDVNGGSVGGPSNVKGMTATFVSIAAAAALIAIISLLVLRRRRQRRRGHGNGRYGNGRSMKERLRIQGLRMKGSGKDQSERDFYLMREEEDDDENHEHGKFEGDDRHSAVRDQDSYNSEVAAAVAKYRKSQQLDISEAGSSEKYSSEVGSKSDSRDRNSSLIYPADAYLGRPSWRKSASNSYMYSDDDFTMSSMRSSHETSSVVRQYWVASMAARAERLLEGHPPSRQYHEEGSVSGNNQYRSPSFSSQSRKADIMSFDASSGTGSLPLTKEGPIKRHYRNTMNSINGYLRRSMSMSLTSLQTGGSLTDNESWHRHPGFRASINAEYLDHLNIKSLRSEERQMAYYSHYYRQNPTMSTVDGVAYDGALGLGGRSQTMTTATTPSWRTSATPSLTSTNDPFQTFDSNEILLDMNPFSDQHAVTMASSSSSTEESLNEKDFLPLPPPPPLQSISNSGSEGGDRSNSALLRSFPSPPPVSSTRFSTGPFPPRTP
ncbi:hypothetical protein BX616_002452 [Lobosporangium transversale]|uniref:Uncharacterized protein n=1 Tax=Lobosporangium transversale TaxID=64571 RepID=A0A1Y2GI22_9FUNG|nr:hypothetical protein BCR41DRAFT_357099 [Lobosporangium transversale]KAF9900932.1 hypothetical protein BX616_002452 [Lobosporangium transversale]ORZ11371.1 hypothetical protein BCR41DRAFT_357099 [Lobosporangium transversale]|eukprot:XP_021879686.1 hypothetical protein BCR41DRAFT_357099 [Lobosporangium transversale]